jgi:hypothetical protein
LSGRLERHCAFSRLTVENAIGVEYNVPAVLCG